MKGNREADRDPERRFWPTSSRPSTSTWSIPRCATTGATRSCTSTSRSGPSTR
ncbi:MAG: hypothetical protein MZU95_15480 [Desulfomicrobium escambiense]|nr:hypothetical protein [Desulfomicrobium escambiense]